MLPDEGPSERPVGLTKAKTPKAARVWPSLEVRADLDENVVVEALAKLLWSMQKSRANTGRNGMGSRESNRK